VNEQAATEKHPIGLKPQRPLFILLSVVMALWMCALVTMYLTTVWPQRHTPAPLQRENELNGSRSTTMNG